MIELSPELAQVAVDLPNMPRDIIEQWLAVYVRSEGWPPALRPDGVPLGRWGHLFGLKTFDYWRRVRWQRQDIALDFASLTPRSKDSVNDIIGAHVNGESNFYSLWVKDGRQRFESILQHLASHGILPCPIVAVSLPTGYWVVDGNHRAAAVCAYRQAVSSEEGRRRIAESALKALAPHHTAWIGTPEGAA